jgi:hypothetical protein
MQIWPTGTLERKTSCWIKSGQLEEENQDLQDQLDAIADIVSRPEGERDEDEDDDSD